MKIHLPNLLKDVSYPNYIYDNWNDGCGSGGNVISGNSNNKDHVDTTGSRNKFLINVS